MSAQGPFAVTSIVSILTDPSTNTTLFSDSRSLSTYSPISTTTAPKNACVLNPESKFVNLDPVFMVYYLGSLSLVMLVNAVGNVLVLRTIYRHRCLWLPSNIFVCSLGMSDLLFAPMFMLYNLAGVKTPAILNAFGEWSVCRILLMEVLALEICSAYSLVAITITRYIGSEFALRYHHYVTSRNCVAAAVVIWVTSQTLCAIVYAVRIPHAVSTGEYCKVCRYESLYTETELGILTVFQFSLPFMLMLGFYVKMAYSAGKLNKRVSAEALSIHTSETQRSRAVISRRRHKSFVIMSLLIGCFALSYMPMIVYFFIVIVMGKPDSQYEYFSATSRIFLSLNTAVNVFIYAGRMSDFRDCLRRDVDCFICCLLSKITVSPAADVNSVVGVT